MEEIREIPEGWERVELTDYIKFQKSGLSRAIVSQDIGIPVIISGNIQNGKLYTNELKYWYREDPQGAQVENYILKENDILLCFINSVDQIGKVCIFKDFNREAIYTTNLFRIQPNKRVNHEYLYFTLSGNYIQSEIKKIVKPAVNQASFTKGDFQKIKLIAPKSIKEQQKISKILSTLDQNIEKTEQAIEKYINIKNGLMDDLLTGKRRIKNGKWGEETEFKDVEGFGKLPKDWDLNNINELCNIVDYRGKTPEKVDTGTFLVTAKNIRNGKIDYNISKEYVITEKYEEIMSRGLPKIGDVLITTEAPLGEVASVDNEGIALAQRIIKLRGKKGKLENAYLKYYFLGREFQKEIKIDATGSTVEGIKGSRLKKKLIKFPKSIEEQIQISTVLSKQDHLIQKEQQYLQKLKSLKSGLMEDLLTGKVRVKI